MSANHKQSPVREKIFRFLEDWKKQVPRLRYDLDSRGNIFLPFRGMMTHLVFSGTVFKEQPPESECADCFVIQPHAISLRLPFESKIRDTLLDYASKWFYSYWGCGWFPGRKDVSIVPQAVFTKDIACLESLYHALVEVTSGYWDLAKTLYKSGLLPPPPLNRVEFEERIESWKEMRMGYEKGSVDINLTPGRATATLVFNNLVGDKPGSGLHPPKEMFDVPEPLHQDMYFFNSQDLKAVVEPIKETLTKHNREYEFSTLHQGFPLELFRGQTLADYHAYLGLRFSVRVADEDSYSKEIIEKWKEALVFAVPMARTDFGRYHLEKGCIRFNINIPLYTDKNHHILLSPKFDSKVLEKAILRPIENIREDIEKSQKLFQHLQSKDDSIDR